MTALVTPESSTEITLDVVGERVEELVERSGDRRLSPRAAGVMAVAGAVVPAASFAHVLGIDTRSWIPLLAAWTLWVLTWCHRFEQLEPGPQLRRLAGSFVGLAAFVGVAGAGHDALLPLSAVLLMASTLVVALTVLTRARRVRRVVLVGSPDSVDQVTRAWSARTDVVVAAVVTLGPDDTDGHAPRVLSEVNRVAPDTVLCLGDGSWDSRMFQRLSWELEDTPVEVAVSGLVEHVAPHRVELTRFAGATVALVRRSRPTAPVRAVKAVLDVVGAAVLLVVLSPVLAALFVWVRLDSPGSALFRQERVGLGGRTFMMFKFRTMVTEAEDLRAELHAHDDGNGVLFKIRRDPRVTRAGRWLRRSSLDELPQLVNVLRGEMSLVGPRPALPEEVEQYDERARRRLATRPGITGLWQVSGRSDLDWDSSLALDLDYTDNVTLGRDLAICVRTVRAVTSGRGAY